LLYDTQTNRLRGWLRGEEGLDVIPEMSNWVSPLLKIRFVLLEDDLELYRPDGERFLTYLEIAQRAEQERQRAEQERQRTDQSEQSRYDAIARLLTLGVSVEQVAESLGFAVEEVLARAEEI
jgi:hypothetical protein